MNTEFYIFTDKPEWSIKLGYYDRNLPSDLLELTLFNLYDNSKNTTYKVKISEFMKAVEAIDLLEIN